jgi:hypothetical protein
MPSIDEMRNLAAGCLQSVMQNLSDGNRAADELDHLRTMIESLPLGAGEFCLAMNSIRNAERFLCSDEVGAAAYELRLLRGSLRCY